MDRKTKILNMVMKNDNEVLDRLWVPKYESTKGLGRNDIDVLLSRRYILLTEGKHSLLSPAPVCQIQVEEISSTEKRHVTRLWVEKTKKNIFHCSTDNNDEEIVTSTFERQLHQRQKTEEIVSGAPNRENEQECVSNTTEKFKEEDMPLTSDIENNEFIPLRPGIESDEDYIPDYETPDNNSENSIIIPNQNIRQESDKVPVAKNAKKKRVWNKKDYCYFCNNDVLKFSRHILRHHETEHEVQEILSLSVGHKRRKELFTRLRNTGNFLKSSSSEIVIPVRKPADSDLEHPTTNTYLPCKFCKGFYKRKTLYRHIAKCPDNYLDKRLRINVQSEGQSLFSEYKNDILRKDIFPTMRADEISLTAKKDFLICAVARRYLKSHRDKHFRAIASRKMRQLAVLLIEIKKKIKVTNLFAALDPLNFDILVECTKIISRYNAETQSYGAPSLASHMGTELKECIDVASNMALKKYRQENSDSNKLKNLRELIDKEWRFEISTEANNDLKQKKWNKPSLIPLAEDLTTLKSYTLREGERYRNILQQNPHDEKSFKNLLEITYVQLLLLNRRRIGELERMTVPSYISNINNQRSDEFNSCITDNEKALMKSFRRVVIRGKRGRGVPVLFTEEMVKNTDLLLSLRSHFLLEENIYLFPNTKSSNSICGSKAIYKHVRLAGVRDAAALTSTRLRKHLATMSQVINLSPQDLEQLACFMGHTSEIHKAYYRLPSDVYQMAKVSKLLLLNERGEASKYKGKSLEEINIDLDIEEDDSGDDENEEFININECTDARNIIQLDSSNKDSQVKKKRVLQSWTDYQKKVAISFFKNHLKNKIPPKKRECLQLVNDNPGVFVNKSWEKIKIFVVNTYNKNN